MELEQERVGRRGPGPSTPAVVVLLVAALALIATSAAPPTLSAYAVGEVTLSAGQSVERTVRVHLEEARAAPANGHLRVGFQSANGLGPGWARHATIALSTGGIASGTSRQIPGDACARGCELTYVIRIVAGPDVLPGSVARYEAGVEFVYDFNAGSLEPGMLRLEMEGAARGPVAPAWSVLAGLLALVGGVLLGPALERRLGARRRWPAYVLVALVGITAANHVLQRASFLLQPGAFDAMRESPELIAVVLDPWSVGLLGVLLWGLVAGLRRWGADGGRGLGAAGVATVGLGGLWLLWMRTSDPILSPVILGIQLMLLGGLGGSVIGQAWRTDLRAGRNRWWVTLAVLSHGIVIAGLAFVALGSLNEPFGWQPSPLLALVPAALIALGLRRWFSGHRGWLTALDLVVVLIGVLGMWGLSSLATGFSDAPARVTLEAVGLGIALAAALGAFVASLHQLPGDAPGATRELLAPRDVQPTS